MISFHTYEEDGNDKMEIEVGVKFQTLRDTIRIPYLFDGLINGSVSAKIKFDTDDDEDCGMGYLHYYDETNKHGTSSNPGIWINFQYFGFKILASTIDW